MYGLSPGGLGGWPKLSLTDDLVAAAWLHDIGYAPELVETGFHPLDGARYLRREGLMNRS